MSAPTPMSSLNRMGKLIKNHLARLVVMTAATYHIAASLHGFFWPKFFFDFLTKNFDGAVKPVPILQTTNLIFGFLNLAWEWPLEFLAGTRIHRSLELRILLLPLSSLTAVLLYQGTNPALYYLVACGLYFWAYTEGEVVCAKPWTLPRRPSYTKQLEQT